MIRLFIPLVIILIGFWLENPFKRPAPIGEVLSATVLYLQNERMETPFSVDLRARCMGPECAQSPVYEMSKGVRLPRPEGLDDVWFCDSGSLDRDERCLPEGDELTNFRAVSMTEPAETPEGGYRVHVQIMDPHFDKDAVTNQRQVVGRTLELMLEADDDSVWRVVNVGDTTVFAIRRADGPPPSEGLKP